MKIILKNILSNWFIYGLNILVVYIMTPLMVRYLGKEAYGIWLLINSLTGYLGLFDFGLQSSLTKYIAEYIGRNDTDNLDKLISTAFYIFSIIACAILLVTGLLSIFINNIFTFPDAYRHIAPYILLITGSQVSLLFLFAVFAQMISGMQRYDIHGIIGTITLLVRSILIYYFLKNGYGLLAVALIGLIATLLGRLPYVIIVKYLNVHFKIIFNQFDRGMIRQIVKYSKISFVIILATKLLFYTDNIVVGSMVSMSAVAVYGIAGSMIDYIRGFILSASNVLNPATSYAQGKGDDSIKSMALITTKYTTLIITPVYISFILLGDVFIRLWLGKGFNETYVIFVILSIAQLISLPFYGIGSMLYGLAKHEILAKSIIVEGVMNLILSLILVKYFGPAGVALGTAIAAILMNFIYLPFKATHLVDLRPSDYYFKGLLKPFIITIPFVISLNLFKRLFGYNTWLQFTSIIFCSLIIHIIIIYLFDLQFILPAKYKILNKSILGKEING